MKKIILLSALTATLLVAGTINFEEANANPKRVAPSSNDVVLSYHHSIKDAKRSVVNISTTKVVKQSRQLEEMFNNPLFKDFFGRNFQMPERKRKASSLGSGVIISKDGYIITNNHVVEGADEILVTLLDTNKEYEAEVVGLDPKTDLAVIKIKAEKLHAIPFADSSKLMEGDMVFAIGNPFGVGGSVTQGIVSALNKSGIGLNQYENFIQTDASINPGNSGGALVDSRGALVGINSAILSRSGGNNGIGFAIPANMAKTIAKSLIEKGTIERGYMGVSIADLNKDLKEVYDNKAGALILGVEEGGPSDKAGLKRGDLVIKINGQEVTSSNDLKNIVGGTLPGKTIDIVYERDNKIKKTSIKLAKMDSDKATSAEGASGHIKGLSLETLDDEIRYRYRIPRNVEGVLVLDVAPDSDGERFGFRQGDIIVQVEQSVVTNLEEFDRAFKKNNRTKKRVWVNRGGYISPILVK